MSLDWEGGPRLAWEWEGMWFSSMMQQEVHLVVEQNGCDALGPLVCSGVGRKVPLASFWRFTTCSCPSTYTQWKKDDSPVRNQVAISEGIQAAKNRQMTTAKGPWDFW